MASPNSKIIGFLISEQSDHPSVDVFSADFNYKTIQSNGLFLHLWGLGNIDNCRIDGKYSLSYPMHSSLLDRNILIEVTAVGFRIENDWLGSIPVFYNKRVCRISTLINLCKSENEIDHEGLYYFAQYGYSVFEKTMYKNIRFMRFYSVLKIDHKRVEITYKNDPVLEPEIFNQASNEKTVLGKVKSYINESEKKIEGEIILPVSGGYDSRLLALLVEQNNRIRAFTYGTSGIQALSREVVLAKKVCKKLKIKWQRIELTNYNQYIEDWFKLYGASTHLHGMYHIEFFSKVRQNKQKSNCSLLSGIVGDAWAGALNIPEINNADDLIILGHTHRISLSKAQICIKPKEIARDNFFASYSGKLAMEQIRIIFLIRFKMMLLSYLMSLPDYFGMPSWTPFLSFDIAVSMLALPEDSRRNRLWQWELFGSIGLNVEDNLTHYQNHNLVEFYLAQKRSLPALSERFLEKFFQKKLLRSVESIIFQNKSKTNSGFFISMLPERILHRFGLLGNIEAYINELNRYYLLKTIDLGLAEGE